MHAVAMPDWRVSLKEHHEGYITLEEFFKNQERLEKNRTNGEEMVLSGPGTRRLGLTARAAVVRQLWSRTHGTLPRQRRHLSHLSMQLVTPRRLGEPKTA